MRRSAVSVRRAAPAALAILFGALLLVSFVVDGVRKAAPPAAIGGRRMMLGGGAGGLRTLEDFKAHDPFQDSKRRVPNGPDPIHNSASVVIILSCHMLPFTMFCWIFSRRIAHHKFAKGVMGLDSEKEAPLAHAILLLAGALSSFGFRI
ncbi:CLE family OsCLE701 protein [Zea mays]|uniref:CLE family OsCLE701 protein n=1 Tax=Zea mays TaxID=4577 RepID=A0A1D6L858_MAIZE|nr:CLE family OsCLE701 protein [Zea mays]